MPLPFLAELAFKGVPGLPDIWTFVKIGAVLLVVAAVKWYCGGASNTAERQMHSKVVMITGGTSGIGAAIAFDLAKRGAQIVLLTHHEKTDFFLVEFIDRLRETTGNELIYAEQVDLSSLHSIRQFATKWIDNAPPRRLDMIILCAATLTPAGKPRVVTDEGIEETWMVNYVANFHLLSILSPAIRAQPADRDVRILFATCPAYIGSPTLGNGDEALTVKDWSSKKAYARSKLALMVFGQSFQKHLDSYKRPDGLPVISRVAFVDPGHSRTPGMRRWLSRGTLWGLALYVVFYQTAWVLLKSSQQGAQSFLFAAMDISLGRGSGVKFIKECMELDFARTDVRDEEVAKKLWAGTEKLIERVEKEEAIKRAVLKKKQEAKDKAAGVKPATSEKEPASSGTETKKTKSRKGKKAS